MLGPVMLGAMAGLFPALPTAVDAAEYTYVAADVTAGYDPENGIGSFTTTLNIVESSTSAGFPNDTQAFSMGLAHDGSLLFLVSAAPTGDLAAVNGGGGPVFEGINLAPEGGVGLTAGIVYSLTGGVFLSFEEEKPVLEVGYEVVEPALAGDFAGVTTALSWTDTLGDPEVTNTVVVGGASSNPILVDGSVTLLPEIATPFLRGDANDDALVDIADGIWLLNMLFLNGPEGTCPASGNANGDGDIDQADAIYVLNYQFLLGPSPPAPFPGCGVAEDEACESFSSCEG